MTHKPQFQKRTGISLKQAGLAAFATALTFAAPAFAQKTDMQDLTIEQRPIASIGENGDGPTSDIKVQAWVDRRDATYAIGDKVSLQVRANRDVYITVLDIGTSGRATVLFPNRFQPDNRVRAYDVVQIPGEDARFRIRAGGPVGREVLKVFATDRPIEAFDIKRMVETGPYYAVPNDGESVARDLSIELKEKMRSNYGVSTRILRIIERDGRYDTSDGGQRRSGGRTPEQDYQAGEAAFYGENTGSNLRDAVAFYMSAARGGHVLAMVRLGQLLEQGVDGRPDFVQALTWYQRAAELGSPQAMVKLGRMYYEGRGVRPDFAAALSWLSKAAQAGDGIAMAKLARAYDEGRGVAPNPREAAQYALNAIKAGAWSVQNEMPEFTQATREEMQRMLAQAGLYRGPIDGVIGTETRAALAQYSQIA